MTGAELQIPPRFASSTDTTMNIIIKHAKLVWQNPYVTDGLIAMWDGQWNAAKGRHDSTALRWINLVTGEYATPVHSDNLTSDISWGPNYAYFNGRAALIAAAGDMPNIAETNNSGECELDGIFRVEYPQATSSVSICGTGWTFHIMENFYHTNYNYGGTVSCIQHNIANPALSGHPHIVPLYIWMTNRIINAADLQRGTRSSKSATDTITIRPESGFGIGQATSGPQTPLLGRIYNIRIYNRALTDLERSANYVIDNTRFGLL